MARTTRPLLAALEILGGIRVEFSRGFLAFMEIIGHKRPGYAGFAIFIITFFVFISSSYRNRQIRPEGFLKKNQRTILRLLFSYNCEDIYQS